MENQIYTTAAVSCASRKLFAPMFRARWQSMQNIVNDSVFIDKVPAAYKTYYIAYIQQWLQWSRGFVPQLHRQDFFSTGMGYTVCDMMTKMLLSGGYRLKSTDAATQEFIRSWCKDDLNNVFNKMFFDANAGGNALLVLTPVGGRLYPSVMPINRVVFQIGRTGAVSSCMILNRFIGGECAYYAKEYRFMIDGVAYWKVELAAGTQVTNPTWGDQWCTAVPPCIAEQWAYSYGSIQPGKCYRMPKRMRGIGVYNVKNKSVASAMTDIPGYSDSTLHTCLDVLYSIDFNYTQAQVDQYMGKSRTLVPKQMGGRVIQGRIGTLTAGHSFREAMGEFEQTPLEDTFYTQVGDNTVDGKPIQPTFIQPDLRGEAHRYIRDSDIELLASKIGISASTICSHLAGGGTKTDDQINAENSIDEKTVGNKRMLASRAINTMLSDVAYFHGFEADVEIIWGRSSNNSARENEELIRDYQAGTLPLREYLKRRWVDLDEATVEKMAQEIEKKQREDMNMGLPFMDEGGAGGIGGTYEGKDIADRTGPTERADFGLGGGGE